jgi:non-ribosomal peptide synthetase component F
VLRQPDARAIHQEDLNLTFAELDAQSTQLARFLIAQGIGAEHIVGTLFTRDVTMVVALLAIQKTGAAYLPLDPEYPAQRLHHMLQDSGCQTLLFDSAKISIEVEQLVAGSNVKTSTLIDLGHTTVKKQISLESEALLEPHELVTPVVPANLAYVIYTSGSTGLPKGVAVDRQSYALRLIEHRLKLNIEASDVCLQLAGLAFDVAAAEIGMALISGATLALVGSETQRYGVELVEYCNTNRVTHFMCVPNVLQSLPDDVDFKTVSCMVIGGESTNSSIISRFANQRTLINAYGPCLTANLP